MTERQIRTAYVSEHPDVLAWWEAADNADRAFRVRVQAFMAPYSNHEPLGWSDNSGVCVSGLNGCDDPGVGWRSPKSNQWVPRRSTPEGKQHEATLAALGYQIPFAPGQPRNVRSADSEGIFMCNATYRMLAGRVWATWKLWGDEISAQVDADRWTKATLGDYWNAAEVVDLAMREASRR